MFSSAQSSEHVPGFPAITYTYTSVWLFINANVVMIVGRCLFCQSCYVRRRQHRRPEHFLKFQDRTSRPADLDKQE